MLPRKIFIFSQIDAYTAEFIVRQLLELDRESNEEITMFINSPGGYVTSMFGIIDTMNVIKSPIRTVVMGIAASAAAVIASAGDTRLITENAQFMLHEISAGTFGSMSEMRESLEQIEKQNELLLKILADNSGQPVSVIKKITNKQDKYFSAEEAVEFGLCDKIIKDEEAQTLKLSEGINVEGYEFSQDNKEVQLLRDGKFSHPVYGEVLITEAILHQLKKNFDDRVRGQDISIDYTHDNETGEKPAAFWIKDLDVRENSDGKGKGLFARGEFTPKGAKLVAEKEYRYSSADFVIDYIDQSGKHHPYVLRGGTLTNRPFIKNMNPIKLSEYQPKEKEISQMDKEQLIAALKAHGIDVSSLMATEGTLGTRVKELEAKLVELNALPAQKEAEIKVLKDKLAEINGKIIDADKVKTINDLVASGKVVPAQKDAILKAFKTGEEIAEFYKDAPAIVSLNSRGNQGEADGDLTPEEQALVNMGMYTKQEIIAYRSPVKKETTA